MQQKRSYKEIYEGLINDPSFKRRSYIRRTTGLLFFVFIFPVLLAVKLGEIFFGFPPHAIAGGGFMIAYAASIWISEKMANKKFKSE